MPAMRQARLRPRRQQYLVGGAVGHVAVRVGQEHLQALAGAVRVARAVFARDAGEEKGRLAGACACRDARAHLDEAIGSEAPWARGKGKGQGQGERLEPMLMGAGGWRMQDRGKVWFPADAKALRLRSVGFDRVTPALVMLFGPSRESVRASVARPPPRPALFLRRCALLFPLLPLGPAATRSPWDVVCAPRLS